MNDTEIKALIAECLEEPDAAKTARLQEVLAQYPEYAEEFARQQALRSAVSHLSHQAPVDSGESLWGSIAGQLKADERAEVGTYEFEFISAYYDGEIPSGELETFEAQLFHNTEANRMLADVGELSELVRNFGYRLEESCTVDVTAAVMARYQAEVSGETAPDEDAAPDALLPPLLDPLYESLSALYDQELSARETIELNARIESDEDCRRRIGEFNELSDHIQRVAAQIEAQAPDLLPLIAPQLPAIIAESTAQEGGGRILPFKKRFAVPVAAAAVLLLLFNLNTQPPTEEPGRMLSEVPASYEIAAMPAMRQVGGVQPVSYEPGAEPVGDEALSPRQVATRVSTPYARAHRDQALAEVPSAEAYLFETLERQVSSEDELPLLLSDDTF